MSRILYGHDLDVAHWVAERIPHMRERIPYFERGMVFGPPAAMGVLDSDGQLIAGVVFHNYDPFVGNIEVSCAATTPMWADPDAISELLRYPFVQLGCRRVTATTPRRSTSTRRFLEGLNFRREGSIRRVFGEDSAIVYGLLSEDWATHRVNQPGRASRRGRGVQFAQSSTDAHQSAGLSQHAAAHSSPTP